MNRTIIISCAAVLVIALALFAKNASTPKPQPPQKRAAVVAAKKGEPSSSVLKKLLDGGEPPKLTPEQLRAYVENCHHSAASLLAAWQLGSDSAWLDEAVRLYPDDPKVALAKLSTLKELNEDAKEWIECLKKNDPENGVGWCYEAMSAFKSGSIDEARDALAAAAKRGRFGASWADEAKSLSAAYESAGYDGFVSELVGTFGVRLPQAQLAMGLTKEAIAKLGDKLDDAAIQDIMAIAHSVRGQSDTTPLIMNLVASSMERRTLDQLSALELIPGTRKIVVERLDELDQERSLVKEVTSKSAPLLATLDESELKQYFRRTMVEGELKAMQWLISQHPQ